MSSLKLNKSLEKTISTQDAENLNILLSKVKDNSNIHEREAKTFEEILSGFEGILSPVVYEYIDNQITTLSSLKTYGEIKQRFEYNMFSSSSDELKGEILGYVDRIKQFIIKEKKKALIALLTVSALGGINSVHKSYQSNAGVRAEKRIAKMEKKAVNLQNDGYKTISYDQTSEYQKSLDFLDGNTLNEYFKNTELTLQRHGNEIEIEKIDYQIDLSRNNKISKDQEEFYIKFDDSTTNVDQRNLYYKIVYTISGESIDLSNEEFDEIYPVILEYIQEIRETQLLGQKLDVEKLIENFPSFQKIRNNE